MTTCAELCQWITEAVGTDHKLSTGRHILPGRLLVWVAPDGPKSLTGTVTWAKGGQSGTCKTQAELNAVLVKGGLL